MAKVLIWSDLHAHPHKFGATVSASGQNSRLADCIDIVRHINVISFTKQCSLRLFCGDMFHVRGKIAPSVLNPVYRLISESHTISNGMLDVMIPGNHDDEARSDGETSIDVFSEIPGVDIFKEYGFDVEHIHENPGTSSSTMISIGIGWVAYHPDVEVMRARIKRVSEIRADRLRTFGDMGCIFIMHHGVDKIIPGIPDAGLTVSDLPVEFDWIFCGDYHHHREIIPGKAWFVGAPLQHNFGDTGENRGYLILDLDTGKVEQHVINSTPEFVTLRVTGNPPVNELVCTDHAKTKLSPYKDNFVRIVCDNEARLQQLTDMVVKEGAKAVQGELEIVGGGVTPIEKALISMDSQKMFEAFLAERQKTQPMSPQMVSDLLALNREVMAGVG
jgi:DNA repair exonuclease SbcCD nuclease subunit